MIITRADGSKDTISNHDTPAVKNETYIMAEESAQTIFIPSVTIFDVTISFSFDPPSSY